MTNLIQRTITGILFICVVCGALILSPVSYAMLMSCIVALVTEEYCRILRGDGQQHPHFYSVLAINVVAFTLTFFIFYSGVSPLMLLLIAAMVWLVFLKELFTKYPNPIHNIALTILGAVYIGMPFALLNMLVFKDGSYDYRPLMSLFILSWVNDTGAYICGISFGKHKLLERISPKKTIEGFVGGVIFTVLASLGLHYISGLNIIFCILCGLIVSIVGTCGDLIESMFKRSVNMKDSGRILPGHGGMLDRFDAIVFTAPVISLLYYFFYDFFTTI